MRRTLTVLGLSTLLAAAAASLVVLPNGTSRAAATEHDSTFLISANDGYGLGDCLSAGKECGKIVANAWCEAQGFARAETFGRAQPEEFTGTVEVSFTEPAQAISITCAK